MSSGDHIAKSDAKEMLLKEYDSLSSSLWKNEETGETRVNWFIGIVAVGIGGLLKLISEEHRPHRILLGLIVSACLLGLLVFGFVTLCRMMRRNKRSDLMIEDLDAIRQIFRDHFDDSQILLHHQPFGRSRDKDGKVSSAKGDKRSFGGLADLVLTINSLLVAGLIFTIVLLLTRSGSVTSPTQLIVAVAAAFTACGIAFKWQYDFARATRDLTHAGGVVYRTRQDAIEYLLVGPKNKEKKEWILPKGHIKPKEKAREAALREVKEETGVVARVVRPLEVVSFRLKLKVIRCQFYLMEATDESGTGDGRERDWFSFEKAVRKAEHFTTRTLLCAAELNRLRGR